MGENSGRFSTFTEINSLEEKTHSLGKKLTVKEKNSQFGGNLTFTKSHLLSLLDWLLKQLMLSLLKSKEVTKQQQEEK